MADATLQFAYRDTPEETRTYINEQIERMHAEDRATFFRLTWFDEHRMGILEGWKVRPDDHGPPPELGLTYAEPRP